MKTLEEMLNEAFNPMDESFTPNEIYAVLVVIYRLKGNKLNYIIALMSVPSNVKDIQSYIDNNHNKGSNEVNVLLIGTCKHNDYKLTKLIDNAHTVARQNIKRK